MSKSYEQAHNSLNNAEIDALLEINHQDHIRALQDEAWAELQSDVENGWITPEDAENLYYKYFHQA